MKILIVAATEKEIAPLLQSLTQNGNSFGTNEVQVLVAGVGAVNTAYHLTKKLNTAAFDLVVQGGVAGAFQKKIALGNVMVVWSEAFGDLGTEEKGNFQTLFQSNLAEKDEIPFEDGRLVNKANLNKYSLPLAKGVSINKVTDNQQQQDQLLAIFNPDIESMEGAAFHYVCLQEKVPFIQLRAISNYVGERNKKNWKMKEAIENLNKELERIIVES